MHLPVGVVSLVVETSASAGQDTLVVADVVGNELVLVGVKMGAVGAGDGVDLALLTTVVIAGSNGSLEVDPPVSVVSVCIDKKRIFFDRYSSFHVSKRTFTMDCVHGRSICNTLVAIYSR